MTRRNNIPKPEISPAFTMEDIHRIREWHYERQKGMTTKEICEDIRKGAARFEARLKEPVDSAIEAEFERRMAWALGTKTAKEPVSIQRV